MLFTSSDAKFNVQLSSQAIATIANEVIKASVNETGGVLFGIYSLDLATAFVQYAQTAPNDSKAGRTWFNRGVKGLQKLVSTYWKDKKYYLGEWHSHPYSSAEPSNQDLSQMRQIALSLDANCPEPILIIVGGHPNGLHFRCFVVTKKQKFELNQINSQR